MRLLIFHIISMVLLSSGFSNEVIESNKNPNLMKVVERLCSLRLSEDLVCKEELSFIWPVKGVITQDFHSDHEAIDITGLRGRPILAIEDGVVVEAKYNGRLGNIIKIKHANGFESFYAHNEKLLFSKGQKVKKGDKIAEMGNTGAWSTGVHLHFEIIKDGKRKDPINYLPSMY